MNPRHRERDWNGQGEQAALAQSGANFFQTKRPSGVAETKKAFASSNPVFYPPVGLLVGHASANGESDGNFRHGSKPFPRYSDLRREPTEAQKERHAKSIDQKRAPADKYRLEPV